MQIAEDQVRLQRLRVLVEDLAADRCGLIRLPVAPERFGQRDAHIVAVGLVGEHLAELGDRLREHLALGVEPAQPGAAEAQLGMLAAPCVGVEAKQLAAQLGDIRLDLQRLLEFGHGAVQPPLPLVRDAQADMRRDVLGVGAERAGEGLLRAVELAAGEVRFAEQAVCLQVAGVGLEDVFSQASRSFRLVALDQLPSLVVGRLQADSRHHCPPAAPPRGRRAP